MDRQLLMGIDLGGGGARALLVDAASGEIWSAARPWRFVASEGVPMGCELEVERTWSLLGAAAREAIERAGARPEEVAGLAATSMRHGSAVLDAEGAELLLTPNRDARGLAEALEIAASGGEDLHRAGGHWPNPVQPMARLLWMARHAGPVWQRAAFHLSLSDWVAYRLCGELATEPSQAGETPLLELESREWAWAWIDRLSLPRRLFPPLRPPGTRLGALGALAAQALGLRAGTPVAVGGADSQCALLAAGAVAPGQLGVVAGSSAPVQQVLDRPRLDPEARLWTSHHVVPGLWVLESNAGAVGEALVWLAGALYADHPHPVVRLLADAAESGPGASGIHSTFGAEPMDARRLALPLGNLSLSHLTAADDPQRRRHLARAVVEGLVYGLRANLDQVLSVSGTEPECVRLTSGLSRSALFAQLLADVVERPVEVCAPVEASALGAAICAGAGAGVFRDLAEGAARLARVARRCEPDAQRASLYRELYGEWTSLREARRESDAAATAIALRGLAAAPASGAVPREDGFRPRILVSADCDPEGLAALGRLGEVEYQSYRQAMRLLTGPSLVEALRGVHVFVTEIDVVDARSLLDAPDLRVVAVCRGDAVNVDLEACTALGIPVLNAPGRNADAVADLALAFLLMLARKLPEATAFLREPGGEAGDMGRMGRAFGRLQGRELWRKTVGLVGLGAVGRRVVERLRPFGARCLVFDPFLDPDAVRLAGAEPAALDELLARSDFVSLHAAVTDASRGLIGAEQLARMRPGSCLVNTARAALVDEGALLAALRSGHLAGAALDVFCVEPPGSDHPLLQLPQVIATPHVGGNTAEVAAHQGRIVADDLERLRRGQAPHHLLNPETLEYFSWGRPRPAPSAELAERLGRGPGPAVTDLQKGAEAPAPRREPKPEGAPAVDVRDGMERILRAFVARIVEDHALRAFAAGQEVTLHFALSDLGLEFHFGFHDGAVVGGLGAPERTAPVQLKMKAALLDGMFTGRANAMQAAMNGELSFSGDAAKAMTLTHINADLNRLYREARDEAGDPGDLSAIPDPQAESGDASPRGATGPVGDDDVRRQLVEVVTELYAAQLITATGGNVSARRSDVEDEAWITPSQLFKGDLTEQSLVRIDMDGRGLDPAARSPSSEALMHTAVLKARPDAQAVIHCHAPHATILANAGLPFLPISTEAAFLVNIGRIHFVMPGTQELADAIVEAMGDGWAVLMQNHGLLVAGRSLRRAADMCEIIERTCQVIIGCYAVGKEPPVLPEKTVEMLSKYGDLMA